MGLAEILFLVFLILKLVGTIDWSWWWVTAPLWITYGLALLWILIVGTAASFGGKSVKRSLSEYKSSIRGR